MDPGGAYALRIPSNYSPSRSDFGEGLTFASIFDPKQEESGPHIDILSQDAGAEIDASQRPVVSKAVVDFVTGVLNEEGEVTSQKQSTTKFDGRDATKVDITFKDDTGTAYKGWITVVFGKRNVVAIMPYAPAADAVGWKLVEGCALSCAIEKKSPNSGAGGGGLLTKESMAQLGSAMKGNLKRDSVDKVIVAGDPPLTYGSVANFVTVVELLFDIQFTEAEFNATRERFVEYYNKQDAQGKAILARQGEALLKSATEGTDAEIRQSREEGRAVFANAFEQGAARGDGYAQTMWAAVQRRQNKLAEAKGTAKEGWDTEITEADVEATLEMLYFMWVAAGRDAGDVTAEDVQRIRSNIYQELPEMDPQLQLVIANAQKIYAGMRQQWMSATPEQRLMLGGQYGHALDSFGLPEGGVTESAGGGGGGGGSDLAAIAQNTAWNAAKTWTTTSN